MHAAVCSNRYDEHMSILLPVLALLAAQGATGSDSPIVVTGRPNVSPVEAQQFVAQVTDTTQGNVARFQKPVCPMVIGLAEGAAETVATRLRETARGIGAQVAPPPCEGNLIVILTDNGTEFLADSRRKQPNWFHGLSAKDVRRLIETQSAARAWSIVSSRNEDGLLAGSNDPNEPRSSRAMSASILRGSMRLDIELAFVVIERSAVGDKTLAQIADYAAMRGLVRTHPGAGGSVETILDLFEGNRPRTAQELTRADILYLQSVYRLAGTEGIAEARSRLSRDVTR